MSSLVVRPVDTGWRRRDKYLTCATVVRLQSSLNLEQILPYFACKSCSVSSKDCKSERRNYTNVRSGVMSKQCELFLTTLACETSMK